MRRLKLSGGPELALPREDLGRLKVPSLKEILEVVRGELRGVGISEITGFSNAAENDVLDSVFGDGGTNLYTAPTYLALTTAAVAETDTGSTLTEANYTGYARKAIAAADMAAASGGSKSNGNALVFANCTAGSSTIIGWAVCTASTAGAVILGGTCTSTVISTTQTPPQIAIGLLSASLD